MIPKVPELLQQVLELIEKQDHKRKTATILLAKKLKLSQEEMDQKLEGGGNVFENRVGWTFSFLTKAEFIELSNERATYKISSLGKESLEEARKNNKIIDVKFLEENSPNYLKNWKVIEAKNSNLVENNSVINQGKANEYNEENLAFNLEEELIKDQEEFDIQLLEKIRALSWQNFEDFCAQLLEKMGYGVAAKRQIRSRDGGIDGEILEDELGLKGKIYLQAKQWPSGNKIGVKDMNEFLYIVGKKNGKGVFITTSDFSNDANKVANEFTGGFIALINYKELVRLCKKYQHACHKKTLEIFRLSN